MHLLKDVQAILFGVGGGGGAGGKKFKKKNFMFSSSRARFWGGGGGAGGGGAAPPGGKKLKIKNLGLPSSNHLFIPPPPPIWRPCIFSLYYFVCLTVGHA